MKDELYLAGDSMRYRKLKESRASRTRSKIGKTFASGGISQLRSYVVARSKPLATPLVKKFIKPQVFEYRSSSLTQEFHAHNATWSNERALELAVADFELSSAGNAMKLEIGSVLTHYSIGTSHPRTVIDKYEPKDGVINQDIFDFVPESRFEFAVSLSTFEHIGIDEHDAGYEPERALAAVDHVVTKVLAKGGRLILTVPVGYNDALDRAAFAEHKVLKPVAAYLRLDRRNRWQSVEPADLARISYGRPFPSGNGLVVFEALARD